MCVCLYEDDRTLSNSIFKCFVQLYRLRYFDVLCAEGNRVKFSLEKWVMTTIVSLFAKLPIVERCVYIYYYIFEHCDVHLDL